MSSITTIPDTSIELLRDAERDVLRCAEKLKSYRLEPIKELRQCALLLASDIEVLARKMAGAR